MLPFTAVMPMDVQQQAWVEIHAEERFKNGNDIKTIETELNPVLRYDYIWKGGQNHLVAIYKPRFLYTRNWDQTRPNPNLVNLATLNLVDPNKDPFSALHNGGVGYEMVRYDLLNKINQMLNRDGSALAQAPTEQKAVS